MKCIVKKPFGNKHLGDEATVDKLIKSGTNLDPGDVAGKTPLYLAVETSDN